MNGRQVFRRVWFLGVMAAVTLSPILWAQGAPPQGAPPGAQGPPGGLPPGVQGRPGGPPPPASARETAPVDLTGNWVSVITEDWRVRMMGPPKGETLGLPLTPAARAAADAWDPARDAADGQPCRAYGAPVLMRNPGRAQISWQDDNTLKIDYDTGQQTRLLRFGGSASSDAEPSWQGYSVAEWEREVTQPTGFGPRRGGAAGPGGRGGPGGPGGPGPGAGFGGPAALTGSLKVVTTRLRSAYLRRNGVPYSTNTKLTEYFNYRTLPNGDTWFTVVAVIEDPENLTGPLVLSSDFKKEPDGSKRMPMPCSLR